MCSSSIMSHVEAKKSIWNSNWVFPLPRKWEQKFPLPFSKSAHQERLRIGADVWHRRGGLRRGNKGWHTPKWTQFHFHSRMPVSPIQWRNSSYTSDCISCLLCNMFLAVINGKLCLYHIFGLTAAYLLTHTQLAVSVVLCSINYVIIGIR